MKRFVHSRILNDMLEITVGAEQERPVYWSEGDGKAALTREMLRADSAFDRLERMQKDRDEWKESTANAQARADTLTSSLAQEKRLREQAVARCEELLQDRDAARSYGDKCAADVIESRRQLHLARHEIAVLAGKLDTAKHVLNREYSGDGVPAGLRDRLSTEEARNTALIRDLDGVRGLLKREREQCAGLLTEASKLRRYFEGTRTSGCSLDDYDRLGYGWSERVYHGGGQAGKTVMYLNNDAEVKRLQTVAVGLNGQILMRDNAIAALTNERDSARLELARVNKALTGKVAAGQYMILCGHGVESRIAEGPVETSVHLRGVAK